MLEAENGRLVLSLAPAMGRPLAPNLATRVLVRLCDVADLPTPRVLATKRGDPGSPVLLLGVVRTIRMTSYLEGRAVYTVDTSAELRRNVGRMLARIASGLGSFRHPTAKRVLKRDLRRGAALRFILRADYRASSWDVRVLADCINRLPGRWSAYLCRREARATKAAESAVCAAGKRGPGRCDKPANAKEWEKQ